MPAELARHSAPSRRSRSRRSTPSSSAGVRFGCVLADAGYGLSAPFRQALSARGLRWAVGIPFKQKVYPADVALVFPVAGPGPTAKAAHPGQQVDRSRRHARGCSLAVAHLAPAAPKGRLVARSRLAVGCASPTDRRSASGTWGLSTCRGGSLADRRAPPFERRAQYYLLQPARLTDREGLAAIIKARWICEQAHQQLKEELGLDHFEGAPGMAFTVTP